MAVRGRDTELAALRALVDRLVAGEPGEVVVEGDGGIGKSALVAAAADIWRAAGVDVWIVTVQRSGVFELSDVAEPSAGGIDLPRDATGPGPRVNAMLDAIDTRGTRAPLAVVIEDAHWADAASAIDLSSLAARLGGRAVLLAVTTRPAPRHAEIDHLVESMARDGAVHLRLGPIDADAVRGIARDRLGAEPSSSLLTLLAGAGGNPLLVDEALRTLEAEHALLRAGDVVDVATHEPLPPLRLAVLRRSSLVDDDVIDLLRTAAVLGPRFRVEELAVLTGRTVRDLAPMLIVLTRTGLVVDDGAHLAFRHDLVHDALYRDIPRPIRTALHREAAFTLRAAGSPIDQIVDHLCIAAGGGPGVDPAILTLLIEAAHVLLGRSPVAARRLAAAGLDGLPTSDHRRAELLALAAASAAQLGDVDAARRDGGAALALDATPETHHLARLALVTGDIMVASFAQAVADLEAAAAIPDLDADERLRCEALAAYYRIWSIDLAGARRDADRVIAVLDSGDTPVTDRAADDGRGRAHEVLALVELADGRTSSALAHAEAAHAARTRAGTVSTGDSLVHQALGLALLDNDRVDEAIAVVAAGQRLAEESGTRALQVFYATSAAMMNVVRGRLDDAVALADTALDILGDAGTSPVAGLPHAVHGRVALYRGDLDGASAAMDRAAASFATSGPVLGGLAFLTWLGEVHHAAGRTQAAHDTLVLAWQLGGAARYLIAWKQLATALARVGLDQPLDPAISADLRSSVERGAELARTPSAAAARDHVIGLLDRDVERLDAAVAALHDSPRPLEFAACTLDAERLRSGRRRRSAQRPPARPTFGWESLTPTEVLVAELTAEGLTNPQIGEQLGMSRRTAETHLSHVFTKLGISNRTQLAAEIGRRSA